MSLARQHVEFSQLLLKRAEDSKGDADKRLAIALALSKAESESAIAGAELELLRKYEHPLKMALLEQAVLQATVALDAKERENKTALQEADATRNARKTAITLEADRLERIQMQIQNCTIVAPQAGVVVYADPTSRRAAGAPLEEGATVREHQRLIQLPDLSKLEVRVQVHESRIDRVKVGQPVRLRVDAFPDRTFQGKVTKVSTTPDPASWLSANVKLYAVLVSLENPPPGLRIGLTTEAEIRVDGKK